MPTIPPSEIWSQVKVYRLDCPLCDWEVTGGESPVLLQAHIHSTETGHTPNLYSLSVPTGIPADDDDGLLPGDPDLSNPPPPETVKADLPLTDPERLVSIHNRAGGGWNGFVALAKAIAEETRPEVQRAAIDSAYAAGLDADREERALRITEPGVYRLECPCGWFVWGGWEATIEELRKHEAGGHRR